MRGTQAEGDLPLAPAALWAPSDLPDEQVDGPVDIVGLDVPDDGVEEGPDLLVVRGGQRPLLLHWNRKHTSADAALHCGEKNTLLIRDERQ